MAWRRFELTRGGVAVLACVTLAPVLLWLACWPFAGVGVNDDFSYAFTTKRLVETGRFSYNGWSTTILGAQAAWGALFVYAFGFSHDVLRLSTLPLAMACAALMYTLHRRLGIAARWSAFATLVLVGSPLFIPWAASFMTDVPGLACTLALLHSIVSLVRSDSRRSTAGWAAAAAVIGVVGGSIRQTNLAVAATALAIECVRRRREWPVEVAVACATVVAATIAMVRWYARQPLATPDPMPTIGPIDQAAVSMAGMGLSLVLFLVPIGVALLRLARVPRATVIGTAIVSVVACTAVVVVAADAYLAPFAVGLWVGNTLTATGVTYDGLDAPGVRPVVFSLATRVVMAATTYWLIVIAAFSLYARRNAITRSVGRLRNGHTSRDATVIATMLALAVVYTALLVPRAGMKHIFDRYLLVLMPIVTLALLFAARRRLADRGPGVASWALLVLFAAVGVATTRDHFSEMRGRDAVADTLIGEGVERAAISNGLTFDGWTQLMARGYVNDGRIVNAPGAWARSPDDERRTQLFWFLPHTPVVQPRWIVVNVAEKPASLGDRRAFAYPILLPPRTGWLLAWPIRPPSTAPAAAIDKPDRENR